MVARLEFHRWQKAWGKRDNTQPEITEKTLRGISEALNVSPTGIVTRTVFGDNMYARHPINTFGEPVVSAVLEEPAGFINNSNTPQILTIDGLFADWAQRLLDSDQQIHIKISTTNPQSPHRGAITLVIPNSQLQLHMYLERLDERKHKDHPENIFCIKVIPSMRNSDNPFAYLPGVTLTLAIKNEMLLQQAMQSIQDGNFEHFLLSLSVGRESFIKRSIKILHSDTTIRRVYRDETNQDIADFQKLLVAVLMLHDVVSLPENQMANHDDPRHAVVRRHSN